VSSTAQANGVVVGAFVDELVRSGVRHACICPGSRSTPVALALAQAPGINVWTHLDERSAAYFGLGLARSSREPVALLATSGTAAANFLPAVVEAFLSRVPLVVLTADRPHELRDNGAAQTIDQVRLYGQHAKWFFDLPEPEATADQVRLIRTLAARAVATARQDPPGPVHLNWPLREPLVPEPMADPAAWGARASGHPYVAVSTTPRAPTNDIVETLTGELGDRARGLIICGPQDDPEFPEAVAGVAQKFGYPILADPLSGVRCGPHGRSLVLDAYDAFLRDAGVAEALQPEVVLRFGATPTSRTLMQYLQRHPTAQHILVDGGSGWRDPTSLMAQVLHVDARLLCRALASPAPAAPSNEWSATWRRLDRGARQALELYAARLSEPFEGAVFTELARVLPDVATVYVGNSMPVRDMDTFLPGSNRNWRLLSNRGANGIDGVVSSALGASAAGSGPVVLVIGDISFYHDLNGLLAARRHALDLLVVLINNDGGGIFSFLPQADQPEHFESLFGTPHGLDFRPFVEGYGGRFVGVSEWSEFAPAVRNGLSRGGLQVVEVRTDRQRNVELHRAGWRAVSAALQPVASA
jgi:2-succinyl-5-enolpyruvyl-6-hydroxy-3-cyclohexene-1-carboxylate synthase